MCKISLIMLTYNRKEFLERSLTCCTQQDFLSYEIILVNNASTDGSDVICEKYAEQQENLRYVKNDNSNISSGRNLGISKAQGEYVLFVDDDDYFSPQLLSSLYEMAEQQGYDAVICGSTKETEGVLFPNSTGDAFEIYTGKDAVFLLLQRKKFNAALPCKMVKTALFRQFTIDESTPYDDISFTYKLLAECEQVAFLPKALYTFVRHPKNNSVFTTNDSLLSPTQLDTYFKAFRERSVYLTEKFPEMEHYFLYTEWSYMISMVNKISKNQLTTCENQLYFAKHELLKNIDEFSNSPYLLDFEKEFIEKYL